MSSEFGEKSQRPPENLRIQKVNPVISAIETLLATQKMELKCSSEDESFSFISQKGHSNIEIGDKLFISTRTVESHLYSIFQKCGIKSRSQLINLIMSNKK